MKILFSSGRNISSSNNVPNLTVISFGDNNQSKSHQSIALQKLQINSDKFSDKCFNVPLQMREWTEQQRRRLYRIGLNFFNKLVFLYFFNC